MSKKVETIKFNDFMSGSWREQKRQSKPSRVYSMSPFMMMEPTILIIGGIIVVVAIIEKHFEKNDNFVVAETLSVAFNLLLTGVGAVFVFKLLSTIGGIFL